MSLDKLLEFSELGGFCQFDLFGTECSHYQLAEHIDMPSDAQRIDKIKCLIENGNSERILMSHDIHTKHRLVGKSVFPLLNSTIFLFVHKITIKIHLIFRSIMAVMAMLT